MSSDNGSVTYPLHAGDVIVPGPDPTIMTTKALQREVATIYDRMSTGEQSLREIIETRLEGMDAATSLRLAEMNDVPSLIQHAIDSLRSLQREKFTAIAQQFSERDIRTDQASRASKEALDAALLAAKELVGATNLANAAAAAKAEDNFTKQIDQITTLIQTSAASTDARITEIKERIDRGPGEQALQVRDHQRFATNETRLNIGAVLGAFSVMLVLIFGVASLIISLKP